MTSTGVAAGRAGPWLSFHIMARSTHYPANQALCFHLNLQLGAHLSPSKGNHQGLFLC